MPGYLEINTCTWRMIATSLLLLTYLNCKEVKRSSGTLICKLGKLDTFLICKMRWLNFISKAISVLNVLLWQFCKALYLLYELYHISLGYFTLSRRENISADFSLESAKWFLFLLLPFSFQWVVTRWSEYFLWVSFLFCYFPVTTSEAI